MKLNHYFILLFSLFFFVSSSHADIDIKKCKANEGEYVIFDEYDSQYLLMKIVMIVITGYLHSNLMTRHINIFFIR